MSNAKRKLTLCVCSLKSTCELLSCLSELDLSADLIKSARNVVLNSLHKLTVSVGSVVEVNDSLVESLCGICTEHILEVAEGDRTVIELLRSLNLVVAD